MDDKAGLLSVKRDSRQQQPPKGGGQAAAFCAFTGRQHGQARQQESLGHANPKLAHAPRVAFAGRSDRLAHAGAVARPALLDNNTNRVSTTATEATGKVLKRRERYALRDGLRRWTTIPRVEKCGRVRIAADVQVKVYAGRAHYAGLLSCGSVWNCPVCAAKVATRRTSEVHTVLSQHLEAGGGAEFLTLTMPHDMGDALATTRRIAADGWKRVQQGRGWMAMKDAVGITGTIRTLEVTHGRSGWHPHVHALVLTDRPATDGERAQLLDHAFSAWGASVVKAGQRAPLVEHTTISPVRSASDVSAYVTKIGAALEVTQGAAKTGRRAGQRAPFAVLADFLAHGDADDLAVWREWETGMKGAKQLTWSRGLKALFRVDDVTDEALATEDVGGTLVASINANEWKVVCRALSGPCAVLEAAEQGGADAVVLVVAAMVAHWPPIPRDP